MVDETLATIPDSVLNYTLCSAIGDDLALDEGEDGSDFVGQTLETFLHYIYGEDVDFDDLVLTDINDQLDRHGLATIDFDDIRYEEGKSVLFPNDDDEAVGDEMFDIFCRC